MSVTLSFTGTRKGLTPAQLTTLRRLVDELHPEAIHYGNAVGADDQFARMCRPLTGEPTGEWTPWMVAHMAGYGGKCHEDQANPCAGDEVRHPLPPLERNRSMVDESDMLLACPGGLAEEQRSGTWATVRYCRKVGKPIRIVWPDGTVTEEG